MRNLFMRRPVVSIGDARLLICRKAKQQPGTVLMQDSQSTRHCDRPLQELQERIAYYLSRHPRLLHEPYRGQVDAGAHPLTGHCYVAAEALYHMGAKGEGYRPHVLSLEGGGTHWYLVDEQGTVLDPTAAQFDQAPDYQAGRCCGFLTTRPSKRTRTVMAGIDQRGPRVDRASPLLKRCMRLGTWEQRVQGYLSNQAREYANSLAGLDYMHQLYKRRVAPRTAAQLLERKAESLRG